MKEANQLAKAFTGVMPRTSGKQLHTNLINQKNSAQPFISSSRKAPTLYSKKMNVDTFNLNINNRDSIISRGWPKNRSGKIIASMNSDDIKKNEGSGYEIIIP